MQMQVKTSGFAENVDAEKTGKVVDQKASLESGVKSGQSAEAGAKKENMKIQGMVIDVRVQRDDGSIDGHMQSTELRNEVIRT